MKTLPQQLGFVFIMEGDAYSKRGKSRCYFVTIVQLPYGLCTVVWQGMPIICKQSYLSFSYRVVVRSICVDL